jgi:hypothetical protein
VSESGRQRDRGPEDQMIAELDAQATDARQRLALYRRRVYIGRGEGTKLAELERISAGAHERARRARRNQQKDAT